MSRQRRSREEWRQLVVELEKSGLTRQEFATARGVNSRTLENWHYRFRREQREHASMRRPSAVEFVPVKVLSPRLAATASSVIRDGETNDVIEAWVGTMHLRFRAGLDSAYVGRLLVVLSREGAC